MSFMYNPFPYDDPKPINRPELSEKTIDSTFVLKHTMSLNPLNFILQ